MSGSALLYHVGDERPAWVETVTVNGTADNMTSGYTFVVKVQQGSATPVLTKSSGITGATGGAVTVAWSDGELAIPVGTYKVLLVATRASDSAEWTVERTMQIVGA